MSNKKRTRIFFLIGIFLVSLFTFLAPPFQKPDEASHYWRMLAIVGKIRSFPKFNQTIVYDEEYNKLPELVWASQVTSRIHVKFPISLYKNSNTWVRNKEKIDKNIIFLSKNLISYLPQVVGYLINFGYPLIGFFMARLVGGLFFIWSVIFSLKNINSKYRPLVFIYLSIPMLWHQVTAISYDSFFISISLLLFTFLITIFVDKKENDKNYFWFIFLTILISFIKPGNFVFLILLLLVSVHKISHVFKKNWIWIVWCLIIPVLYFVQKPASIADTSVNINVVAQERILVSDPLYFVSSFWRTIGEKSDFYITSFLGQFGWLDYNFALWVYLLISALIIWFYGRTLSQLKEIVLSRWQLFILLIFCGAYIAMVFLGMYLRWTPGGAKIIEGVQGRYFIPIFPFLLFLLAQFILMIGKNKASKLFVILSALFIIFSFVGVTYERYYDYSRLYQNPENLSKEFEDTSKKNKIVEKKLLDQEVVVSLPTDSNKFAGFQLLVEPAEETLIPLRYSLEDGNGKVLQKGYLNNKNIENGVLQEEFLIKSTTSDRVQLRLVPLLTGDGKNYIYLLENFATLLFISK